MALTWAGLICLFSGIQPDRRVQRFVIECKIMWGSREATMNKGLAQVMRYAGRCGADEVYLLIFFRSHSNTNHYNDSLQTARAFHQ